MTPLPPLLIKDLGMIYPKETSKQKRRYGIYKCDCGKEFKANANHIKSKHTQSCGCYDILKLKERVTKHKLCKHPLYKTLAHIKERCYSHNNKSFIDYGFRGIIVFDRWLNNFQNFYDDMFPTWVEGLSIDRIDNNGNYEPLNCRWTTKNIQARNTRVIRSTNTSGYKGVSLYKPNLKWVCHIGINGKVKSIGYFDTPLEAAIAYDTYVLNNNLEHTINGVL